MSYQVGDEAKVLPAAEYGPEAWARSFRAGQVGTVVAVDPSLPFPIELEFPSGSPLAYTEDELVKAGADQVEDVVDHPAHYTWLPVEVIEITKHLTFVRGNAVKYLLRAGRKSADPLEDLRKARWYLDYEIRQLGGA
ncbi:DUF3310 domain-containing protein [Kitasatospora sp. NPDC096147]|uniref:DUF3310 domain-containing protein n=1 Tax=Kitasatospora sp. NPDC096147 TaxID=3364093 RepID=UPI003826FCAC